MEEFNQQAQIFWTNEFIQFKVNFRKYVNLITKPNKINFKKLVNYYENNCACFFNFIDNLNDETFNNFLLLFIKYLNAMPETKNYDEKSGGIFLDFKQDWAKINLMLKQNNCDLNNCELWEFLILLEQSIILNNNLLGKVINYRIAKIPNQNKFNQDEINHLKNLKNYYKINDNLNDNFETKQKNLERVFKKWTVQH